MVLYGVTAHNEDDSISRKRRKQLNTKEWVLGQGTYTYPLETEVGEFGLHTRNNPPSPPASTRGGFRYTPTRTTNINTISLIKNKKKKGGDKGNSEKSANNNNYNNTPATFAISPSRLLKKQRKMSSDVATQTVDKVDGSVKKKNLSSASAATSLKRAEPRQLPSFPSHGLSDLEASAGVAASLAAAKPKRVEYWKPDKLPAAGAAASMAHAATGHGGPKSGQPPSASASASAATALREAEDHQQHQHLYGASDASEGRGSRSAADTKTSVEHGSVAGKAAAKLASQSSSVSPNTSPKLTSKLRTVKTAEDGGQASVSNKTRSRAGSMPTSSSNYGASGSTVNHALTAASLATHSPSAKSSGGGHSPQQGYDIKRINKLAQDKVARELHGSSENRRTMDGREVASTSMSNKQSSGRYSMPTTMRRSQADTTSSPPMNYADLSRTSTSEETKHRDSMMAASAATAHLMQRQKQEQEEQQLKQQQVKAETKSRPYYHNLDEAARKQAAERLRRLAEDHESHRKGLGLAAARHQGTTSNIHDKESSRKIKSEMDALGKRMAEVDRMKQVRDSAALLAKAQQNVQKQMKTIDTKVAEDKGQIPRHLQEQWDARAREVSLKAESKRHEDETAKHGKVDMGGGLWFSKDQLDKIARSNVQPLLDDIEQAATLQRAKEEEARLEKEEADRKKKLESERKKEIKQDEKNVKLAAKELDRRKKEQEKQEKLHLREEARKAKEEEKEQKNYEKEFAAVLEAGASGGAAVTEKEAGHEEQDKHEPVRSTKERQLEPQHGEPVPSRETDHAEKNYEENEQEKESWFHSLGRRLTRKGREPREPGQFAAGLRADAEEEKQEADNSSMRDVALAGTERANTFVSEASQPLSSDDVSEVSSLSREEESRSFNPLTGLSPPHEHSPEPVKHENIESGEELKDAKEVVQQDKIKKEEEAPLTSATFIPGSEVEPAYEHQRSSSASVRSAKSAGSRSTTSHHSKEESKRRSFVGILTKPFRGRKETKEESEAENRLRPDASPLPAGEEKGTRDTFGNMFKRSTKKNEVDPEVRKQHREAEVPDVSANLEQETPREEAKEEEEEESDNEFSEAREDFFEENTIDIPCQAQRAFEVAVRQDPSSEQHSGSHAETSDHSHGIQSRLSEDF